MRNGFQNKIYNFFQIKCFFSINKSYQSQSATLHQSPYISLWQCTVFSVLTTLCLKIKFKFVIIPLIIFLTLCNAMQNYEPFNWIRVYITNFVFSVMKYYWCTFFTFGPRGRRALRGQNVAAIALDRRFLGTIIAVFKMWLYHFNQPCIHHPMTKLK